MADIPVSDILRTGPGYYGDLAPPVGNYLPGATIWTGVDPWTDPLTGVTFGVGLSSPPDILTDTAPPDVVTSADRPPSVAAQSPGYPTRIVGAIGDFLSGIGTRVGTFVGGTVGSAAGSALQPVVSALMPIILLGVGAIVVLAFLETRRR